VRYVEFKAVVETELRRNAEGLTWVALRDQLQLPYERPCPNWTRRLEREIGLSRTKGSGRAFVWKVNSEQLVILGFITIDL